MQFRLLGPLEVHDGERPIRVGGGRRRALLALLLLHRNEVVPADRLIDELWDGEPPPTAHKGLQVHVSHLRKELGNGALVTKAPGYVLQVDPQSIDVVRFERAVTDAARARDDGRPAKAAAALREALALWRGPPLADFSYDRFAREEIARLEELHLLALEERAEAEIELGHHREILPELEQLVADHPSSERLRGLAMVALYRCGRRADSLDLYREGRAQSVDELGIELGPDLRSLEQAVLTDDPKLAAPPREPSVPSTRAAVLLLCAALLLAGASAAAIILEDGSPAPPPRQALDLSSDAIAGIGADGHPEFGLVMPGRPTDMAAAGDRLYAVSTASPALTIADARERRLMRTVRLDLRPAAVAVRGATVWVAGGRRGRAFRLDAADGRIEARARWWRRGRAAAASAERSTGIAMVDGAAWVSDGSRALIRISPTGKVRRAELPYAADGVVAGARALWAFSREGSAVMRIQPRTAAVTDVIPLAGHAAIGAPEPRAIAASGANVWVLNGNTATLSQIDAGTRGVVATVPLDRPRSPRDIAATRDAVWVACLDGSVIRVSARGGEAPRTTSARGLLVAAAASERRVWVASRD